MILNYFVYAAFGRIAIFFLQRFPFYRFIRPGFVTELLACDLCLGVYVYIFLAWALQVNILPEYIPVLSEVLTGATTSFIMYLIRNGWQTEFAEVHIELE